MTTPTEVKARVDSVSYWQGKFNRDEITLDECAFVCRLMIYRERVTLADAVIRWSLALLVAGGATWLLTTL